MIGMITRIFFKTIFPFLERKNKGEIPTLERKLKTPPKGLIDAYVKWSGGDHSKYKQSIPPHMFSQFALHLGMSLLCKVPYKISKIINQGVNVKVHGDLLRNKNIFAETNIIDLYEENGRARVKQKMYIGHQKGENIIEITLYSAFIIGRKKKLDRTPEESIEMETIGHWSVNKQAGLEFAKLTGDFNPIHWVDFIAKKTPFKQTILHGLGQLAKTFELIEQTKGKVKEIELKFIKPVKLSQNRVDVKIASHPITDSPCKLQLCDTKGKQLSVGHVLY